MKFILTKELGRLAKWLRILGFDAEYFKEDNTGTLIIRGLRDSRIILTRNQRIFKPGGTNIILIRSEKIKEQVRQVLKEFNLKPSAGAMFSRCILCNEKLAVIEKEKIKAKVPEYVFKTQEDFLTCPKCGRIYWQGTHWGNVSDTLKELINNGQ